MVSNITLFFIPQSLPQHSQSNISDYNKRTILKWNQKEKMNAKIDISSPSQSGNTIPPPRPQQSIPHSPSRTAPILHASHPPRPLAQPTHYLTRMDQSTHRTHPTSTARIINSPPCQKPSANFPNFTPSISPKISSPSSPKPSVNSPRSIP